MFKYCFHNSFCRKLAELGPRVFGYESNEVEAVQILKSSIQKIAMHAKKMVEER